MRKRNAFTLIELLVVISILVLLMAILLPTLQRVRKQARAAACQANLRQWGTTLALYTEDNQGRLPRHIGDALWLLRGSSLSDDDPNKPTVYHHVSTKGIACCPMAVRSGGHGSFRASSSSGGSLLWQIEGTHGSTFEAWEITSPLPPFRGSYGFNRWLSLHNFDTSLSLGFHLRRGGLDASSVRGAANIPTLLDSTNYWGRPRERDRPPRASGRGLRMGPFCINRHNGHINGLFLDWSVRKIGLKELWTLKWHLQFNTAGPWTKAGGVQPEDWPQWMRRFKDY